MPKLYNTATNQYDEWPWEPELGKVYGQLGLSWDSTSTAGGPWTQAPLQIATKSPAAKICDKAADLIDGERAKQHGSREDCHAAIASLWSAYLAVNITPKDAALMLALVKIARSSNGHHNPDDYIDMVGYAAIAGELAADQDSGC